MRVIVAGGRDFDDYDLLKNKLDYLFQNKSDIIIVSGCAKGADALGEIYAVEHNLTIDSYPADWKSNGRAAGPIRNAQMAENADALVAFWDGKSRGTKHMIDTARNKNLMIRVIMY